MLENLADDDLNGAAGKVVKVYDDGNREVKLDNGLGPLKSKQTNLVAVADGDVTTGSTTGGAGGQMDSMTGSRISLTSPEGSRRSLSSRSMLRTQNAAARKNDSVLKQELRARFVVPGGVCVLCGRTP